MPIQWSPWSSYSPCSSSCGNGTQYRTRICLLSNGKPAQGDEYKCKGENVEIKNCHILPCPVNGGWSAWTKWSEESCSIPCLNDTDTERPIKKRYRKCDSPLPSMGGKPCLGADWEEADCPKIPLCPTNGNWTDWSAWKSCSKSCGIGITSRFRTCSNPAPRNGGKICEGMNLDLKYCNLNPCPINGGWSRFNAWSACSKSCGKGMRIRKRFCDSPEPKYGGAQCDGDNVEFEECNIQPCLKSYKQMENSEEIDSKYGPYAEIEINSLEKPHKPQKIAYLDQKPVELKKPKISDPGKPKVVVSFDTFRQISAETYNRLKNGFVKEPESKPEVLEFESEDDSDYDSESDADLFSLEQPDQEFQQKKCKNGFKYNVYNDQCMDVNECALPNIKCPKYSECVNLLGSFRCDCQPGFRMIKGRCLDVNECSLKTSGCSHICENVIGSFRCKCPDGMKISEDDKTCEKIKLEMKRSIEKDENQPCADGFKNSNGACIGKYPRGP